MKSIQMITNEHLIKALLEIDNAYDNLVYDDSPPLEEYIPKGVWFLLSEDGNTAGFIHLDQMNNVMWQSHIYIMERYRKNGSEKWGKLVIRYMRKYMDAKKFLAITPYESAKKYAERTGFTLIGVLSSSIRKKGVLMNQYILEKGIEQ